MLSVYQISPLIFSENLCRVESQRGRHHLIPASYSYSEASKGFCKKRNSEEISQKSRIIRNYTLASINPRLEKRYDRIDRNSKPLEETCIFSKRIYSCQRDQMYKSGEVNEMSNKIYDKVYTFTSNDKHNFKNDKNELFSDKVKELMRRMLDERKRAIKIIIKFFRKYIKLIKEKKIILINQCLYERMEKIISIQNYFRNYSLRKHIKEIRNYDHIFFYNYKVGKVDKKDLNSSKGLNSNLLFKNCKRINYHRPKEIKLKFFENNKNGQEYSLKYSRALDTYYLPFKKHGVMRRRLRVNFIVDGNTIIDPRYDVDTDNNGHFFNIIESSMFRRKKSQNMLQESNKSLSTDKFWENIFKIKIRPNPKNNSVSDISEQSDMAIERFNNSFKPQNTFQNNKSQSPLKSILKLQEDKQFIHKKTTLSPLKGKKKVTFNHNVQYIF